MAEPAPLEERRSELVAVEAASSTDRAGSPCTPGAATLAAQLIGEDVLGNKIEALQKHTAAMLA